MVRVSGRTFHFDECPKCPKECPKIQAHQGLEHWRGGQGRPTLSGWESHVPRSLSPASPAGVFTYTARGPRWSPCLFTPHRKQGSDHGATASFGLRPSNTPTFTTPANLSGTGSGSSSPGMSTSQGLGAAPITLSSLTRRARRLRRLKGGPAGAGPRLPTLPGSSWPG